MTTYRTPVSCAARICVRATLDTSGRCPDHRDPSEPVTLRREVRGRLDVFPLPTADELHRSLSHGSHDMETWKNRYGYLSRGDGPAVTDFRADTREVSCEEWWVGGLRTRFGGPARIEYRADGSVRSEQWWFDGDEYGSRSYFDRIGTLSDDELDEAFRGAGWTELLDAGAHPRTLLDTLAAGIRNPADVHEVVVNGAPIEWVRAYVEAASR